ncbi:WD40-repeat-containing domain protein [Suillus subalutaceus]|uniref:WD40-repeat-containing domain protein n=1 Tax=Suillus subalutaceus TaxID=48586 RepID=UPI001B8795A9|nr:WD40-repeat-containing domain protein [Suillus subalutaceus]KAG1839340.1 WD40-repeat-containing domain protein [Suillus subalutaceus]
MQTLEGHMWEVTCLAWTKDGKTLISGSWDSIRIWNTTNWWEQTAVLVEHTSWVTAIAISPNDRILASASDDKTARLWNLDNGQPISSPLQHAQPVQCVSFSEGGKLLATGCNDKNAYSWDVAAIVREAGLNDLLLDTMASKSVLHSDATQRTPAYRAPAGFFDGVSPDSRSHFSAQGRPHSSAQPGNTFLSRLFHRSSSDSYDTSRSSPLDWARNLLKPYRQSGEDMGLQGRNTAVVEVPHAKGKRRNASAREVALAKQKQKQKQKMKLLRSKNSTAGSSQPLKPNVAEPSSQPHVAGSSSSTTPAVDDPTITTTSTTSRPDATIRKAGLWTRIWLFIGCLSPEYTDNHH